MVRSEKLIELGNSWFSAKTIEVENVLINLWEYSSGYDSFSFIGALLVLSMVSNLEKP